MEKHRAAISALSTAARGFYAAGIPYRIHHGSTNSTRPRPHNSPVLDISALRNVISIDRDKRIALVEPNVPMDRLVEATLPHGLVPPVVMEFPGITAGGGFAGTAGESSSFREGFFDETVLGAEMLLADGEVIQTSRDDPKTGDLFRGAAGAVGTLGVTTLLKLRLMEAKKFVHVRYHRTHSIEESVSLIREQMRQPENDYIDGIQFSPTHGAIITGTLTNEPPSPCSAPLQTFSAPSDPWFYLHASHLTSKLSSPSLPVSNTVPLAEYLFRYDRGGFWVGRAAFQYFRFVPFTRWTRQFLDDFLHTRMLYRALHASGESARFIVQDVAMPFETTPQFVEYTGRELGIWPLWLCPLKRPTLPTFHPFTTVPKGVEVQEPGHMLNVGVWGWGPAEPREFVRVNRELEAKVRELGGMKWLYAHTYYDEDEFWKMYGGREWYDALRKKYKAANLPSVWDKVHVDQEVAVKKKQQHWMTRVWPLGGFYGIRKSIESRDYLLHRNAQWKWTGE